MGGVKAGLSQVSRGRNIIFTICTFFFLLTTFIFLLLKSLDRNSILSRSSGFFPLLGQVLGVSPSQGRVSEEEMVYLLLETSHLSLFLPLPASPCLSLPLPELSLANPWIYRLPLWLHGYFKQCCWTGFVK